MSAPKVIVGMSGGVDSSVAAYVLQQQGYRVEAMFMQNWDNTTGTLHGDCPWNDDRAIAELVCRQLHIPFHFINLSAEYRQRVADYMFAEYARGRTPNPDVLCNREIKFDAFLNACLALGGDLVATGHYCRKQEICLDGQPTYRLLAGLDANKDQSYFLCQLTQQQLARAVFPIGEMQKPDVRAIAKQLNLSTAERKDSQGICFVGKVDLPVFLQQQLQARSGKIVELPKAMHIAQPNEIEALARPYQFHPDDGRVVGEHCGAQFFTIGQRKGLGVGGHVEPLFVVGTDIEKNIVYVAEGHAHAALNRMALLVAAPDIHWVRPDMAMAVGEARSYMVRIRYRQPLQQATLIRRNEGMYIRFAQPQRGIAAGQFAAWYLDDEVVGSGTIN